VPSTLDQRLRVQQFAELDGAFCAAHIDGAREQLTLLRDPFGVRSLYYVEHRGVLLFATELKRLLADSHGKRAQLQHASAGARCIWLASRQ
jgi:asparagine synthetase B (glutamine-hydrolysing)